MDYNDFVMKRVPPEVKIKRKYEFGLLLSLIKQNSIRTTQQLDNIISHEIDACRSWLAKNRSSSTMNRLRRETVQKLQYLMKVKELVDAHLK
ncbi:MAG: hypothetical protein QXR60_02245 [Candidatus Nanoarchaeia archaeon]